MLAPYPEGELADRDGTFLAFAETRVAREAAGDPRPSLQERYALAAAYESKVRDYAATLQHDRLLLAEDAERYGRDAEG